MRILFIQDNGLDESLLVTETAAYLEASGHRTDLLLEREERDLRGAVAAADPDLVVVPAAIQGHHWSVETCGRLGRWFPDLPVVLAGTLPTFVPDLVQRPGVKMAVVGEAEEALVEICDALAGRRELATVRNLVLRRGKVVHRNELRPLIADLDRMPLPFRDLYYRRYPFLGAFPFKKFSTGRGCFHDCSYCYQPQYRRMCEGKGTYVRRKSPERVVREVEAVARRHPVSNVHFADDLFITHATWLRRFCELYPARIGLPYSINTSADLVSEASAELLARSGCRTVAIGVESGDEGRRRDILGKDLTDASIRGAARAIRRHGITLITFNMLASPGEGWEEGLQTLRFNAELGAQHARVTLCQPLPGTPMAAAASARDLGREGAAEDLFQVPDAGQGRPQVYFTSAVQEEGRLLNLHALFSLGTAYPRLLPLLVPLSKLPPNRLLHVGGGLHRMLLERSAYRLSLLDGLRYFLHTGSPERRTANFTGLI